MYGLVNKAIYGLISQNFGEETWNKIKEKAGVSDDFFISMQAYDDNVTYQLVGAASEVLGASPHDILVQFGNYWIEFTAQQGYGNLMDMAGNNFADFLKNLDGLHLRVGSTYSNLKPPSFSCKEIDDHTILLEYRTHREGLASLVIGLLEGLGKKFKVTVQISHTGKRTDLGYDEFTLVYFPIEPPELVSSENQLNSI